jgi:hypothetical protein
MFEILLEIVFNFIFLTYFQKFQITSQSKTFQLIKFIKL